MGLRRSQGCQMTGRDKRKVDMTMGESMHLKVALRRLPLSVTVIEPNLTMGIVWTL
jgi:hypothetical protein